MHDTSPTEQQPSGPAAGGRLKYANPRDLPSYPSLGLRKSASAAGAAASLGWASQKPAGPQTRHGRSASALSASASAAALLAHDNKMSSPSLPPEASSTAASLQAATLAAGALSPKRTRPHQTQAPSNNLQNAAATALSAAALAHRPSIKISDESGAVPYTTMPRSMFTSTPPVKAEMDQQKQDDKIHSEAVVMARKIYAQQQAMFDASRAAHGNDGQGTHTQGVTSLQDTAYKLAQQRLSKVEGENQKNQDYQSYYGATSPTSRRFGSRGVLRRRASSDTEVVLMQDRAKSDQIRTQMSIFNTEMAGVDEERRDQDRQSLLALAQRNVQAQLAGMDSKITEETGWINPSAKNEWELKAQAAARQRSDERAGVDHRGQVDVGGGKYMDMKAVEEIASKRMKPVLDDIHERAQKERDRLEKLKAEEEARKKEAGEKKTREREAKEARKKQRDQEKEEGRERRTQEKQQERERKEKERQEERARRDQQRGEERQKKEEDRAKKEEENAARHEQKKQAKEERRRDRELASADKALKKQQGAQNQDSNDAVSDTDDSSIMPSRPSTPLSPHSQQQQQAVGGSPRSSPPQQQGNLKTWLKTRLARPRGRSNASAADRDDGGSFSGTDSRPGTRGSATGSGFAGGAALTRSTQSLSGRNDDGRKGDHDFLRDGENEIPLTDRPVSPLSSADCSTEYEDVEEFRPSGRASSTLGGLAPPPVMRPFGVGAGGRGEAVGSNNVGGRSLPRDSRFHEILD